MLTITNISNIINMSDKLNMLRILTMSTMSIISNISSISNISNMFNMSDLHGHSSCGDSPSAVIQGYNVQYKVKPKVTCRPLTFASSSHAPPLHRSRRR